MKTKFSKFIALTLLIAVLLMATPMTEARGFMQRDVARQSAPIQVPVPFFDFFSSSHMITFIGGCPDVLMRLFYVDADSLRVADGD